MDIRAKVQEALAVLQPMVNLHQSLNGMSENFDLQDTRDLLVKQIQELQDQLASERDMLASTANDLTEALQKVDEANREAGRVISVAHSLAEEKLIAADAKASTIVAEAGQAARNRQHVAEQNLAEIENAIEQSLKKKEETENELGSRIEYLEHIRARVSEVQAQYDTINALVQGA